jgi:hypothetical protein
MVVADLERARPLRAATGCCELGFRRVAFVDQFAIPAVVPSLIRPAVAEQRLLIVVAVQLTGEPGLFDAVETGDAAAGGARTAQRRQQQCGENADDCDHDKQFDQRKRSPNWPAPRLRLASDKQFDQRKPSGWDCGRWRAGAGCLGDVHVQEMRRLGGGETA